MKMRPLVARLLVLATPVRLLLLQACSAEGKYKGYPIVQVFVDGKIVESDAPAIDFHGTTMIPVQMMDDVCSQEFGRGN